MTDKKRHARRFVDENDYYERRASRYSFKQYIENIRLHEALEEDTSISEIESDEEC